MKNWNYIDGAKVGNADNWQSYDEMINKAKRDMEFIKQKEREATSFSKKQELASARREIEDKLKYYQKQAGNESLGEYMAKKPRVINEEKTGAEEFFKKLADDVKEREKKDDAEIEKVGNREVYVNQYERTKAIVYEDGTIMLWDKNGNNYKTIKAGSLEEARKKLNSDYKKVGNANLETSVEKGKLGLWNWYVHKDGTIVAGGTSSTETNAKEMARKALEKEKAGNKVGNATILKDGKYVIEQLEKSSSDNYAAIYFGMKKGNYCLKNTKTGVVLGWYTTLDAAKKRMKEWQDDDKVWGNSKAGNSASDDKFAYVMREFDEGKLKTPDGKVVTDPAQAKAIAYSESKKTENGLARARNAMAGNGKAIGSYFNMNNYGIEVGQWSWDWKNGAPDKKTMDDTARKIKDYVRQIDKNVPDGDNDERDEVFAKLDRFMHSQGLK